MKLWTSLLAAAGTVALATGASAAPILISGSGLWAATATASAYSAPNATFSFSFSVPNPLDANPTTQVTGFSYKLNGATVAGNPTSVRFYNVTNGGLFDVNFGTTASINLFGADIGSTKTITPGTYAFTSSVNNGVVAGAGTLTVGATAAVPEPATWAMMVIGAGLAGGALRRRRTVSVRYA